MVDIICKSSEIYAIKLQVYLRFSSAKWSRSAVSWCDSLSIAKWVDRSDDLIACTLCFCVQNTESFHVRYAEAFNRFEQNTFKIFHSIDQVKNFDTKLTRSALRSCDKLLLRILYCYTSHSNNSILLFHTFYRVCLHRVLTGIMPAELKNYKPTKGSIHSENYIVDEECVINVVKHIYRNTGFANSPKEERESQTCGKNSRQLVKLWLAETCLRTKAKYTLCMRLTNTIKPNRLSSTKRSKDKIKLIIAEEEGEGGPKKLLFKWRLVL